MHWGRPTPITSHCKALFDNPARDRCPLQRRESRVIAMPEGVSGLFQGRLRSIRPVRRSGLCWSPYGLERSPRGRDEPRRPHRRCRAHQDDSLVFWRSAFLRNQRPGHQPATTRLTRNCATARPSSWRARSTGPVPPPGVMSESRRTITFQIQIQCVSMKARLQVAAPEWSIVRASLAVPDTPSIRPIDPFRAPWRCGCSR